MASDAKTRTLSQTHGYPSADTRGQKYRQRKEKDLVQHFRDVTNKRSLIGQYIGTAPKLHLPTVMGYYDNTKHRDHQHQGSAEAAGFLKPGSSF